MTNEPKSLIGFMTYLWELTQTIVPVATMAIIFVIIGLAPMLISHCIWGRQATVGPLWLSVVAMEVIWVALLFTANHYFLCKKAYH